MKPFILISIFSFCTISLYSQNNYTEDLRVAKQALQVELVLLKEEHFAKNNGAQQPENRVANVQKTPSRNSTTIPKKSIRKNAKENGKYLLISAVEDKNVSRINELVNSGYLINVTDDLGNTPLLLATIQKLPIATLKLLTSRETINRKNDIGETPLKIAIRQGNDELVDFLIENNAERGNLFNDKIWAAIERNDVPLIRNIISQRGNLSIIKNGETPLTYAIKNSKSLLKQMLIEGGANPLVPNSKDETPYSLALKLNKKGLFHSMLQQNPNSLTASNKNGESVLDICFQYGDAQLIKTIMSQGGVFGSYVRQNQITPLMMAIKYNHPSLYFDFLGKGDVNQINKLGGTALKLSIEKGDLNLLKKLISYGASVNDINQLGNTPLGYAVSHNRINMVLHLINEGADINRPNNFGSTPLMEAAIQNHSEIARILVEKGANKYYRDIYGKTAREIAEKLGNNQVLSYLY